MSDNSGLLLINKPTGLTSHDVVAKVRRIIKSRDVGHSGTLDPLASGLMVILLGEATKLNQYVLEGTKSYNVKALFGLTTDTLDITGKTLSENPGCPSGDQILAQLPSVIGEMMWSVPKYSATKVNGEKMYEKARAGQEFETPIKPMSFFDVEFKGIDGKTAEFNISCSKGSFVRTWVQQLGERLGMGATMSALTRTQSKPFKLEQAIDLAELERVYNSGRLEAHLISMGNALPQVKAISVEGFDRTLLSNGQISNDLRIKLISKTEPKTDRLFRIVGREKGSLLALIGFQPGEGFAIKRVFRY